MANQTGQTRLMAGVNESIAYLKSCADYATEKAFQHFERICDCNENFDTRSENVAKYVGNSSIGSAFPKMWKVLSIYLEPAKWESQGLKNLSMMLNAFANIANDSPELCLSLGKSGAIPLLLQGVEKIRTVCDLSKKTEDMCADLVATLIWSLVLLDNVVRVSPSNITFYRSNNAVPILKGFLKYDNSPWQTLSLLVLAYVATDDEKKALASIETGIRVLMRKTREAINSSDQVEGEEINFSVSELLDAVNKLATNDDVKKVIYDAKMVPDIIRALGDEFDSDDQKTAAETLWNLAFIDSIRQSKELQSAVPTLTKLSKSTDNALSSACSSALFVIQGANRSTSTSDTPPPSYEEAISTPDPSRQSTDPSVQIMISYQWDSQERAKQIRDTLVASGYKVWMDLTHMRGDILESMAKAVQESDVILICMTEQYKDSQSCRTEASYAYKLKKKSIPLLLQENYKPDGWLGLLQGMELYYALHSEQQMNTAMRELLKAIREYSQSTGHSVEGAIHPTAAEVQSASASQPAASKWSKTEVQKWLKDNDFTELCERLERFDGRHLQKWYNRCCKDEDAFEDELFTKYNLDAAVCTDLVIQLKEAFTK